MVCDAVVEVVGCYDVSM